MLIMLVQCYVCGSMGGQYFGNLSCEYEVCLNNSFSSCSAYGTEILSGFIVIGIRQRLHMYFHISMYVATNWTQF